VTRRRNPLFGPAEYQIAGYDGIEIDYFDGQGWGERRRAAVFRNQRTAEDVGRLRPRARVKTAVVAADASDNAVFFFLAGRESRAVARDGSEAHALAVRNGRRKRSAVFENPVPLSTRASVRAATERFKNFRGDPPGGVQAISVPTPKAAMVVGELDGVLYTTERDGKIEKYQHKFRKKSRPLLAASDDGKSLHIVGGQYEFTERGIVDS